MAAFCTLKLSLVGERKEEMNKANPAVSIRQHTLNFIKMKTTKLATFSFILNHWPLKPCCGNLKNVRLW
jgi:hypothetical protein